MKRFLSGLALCALAGGAQAVTTEIFNYSLGSTTGKLSGSGAITVTISDPSFDLMRDQYISSGSGYSVFVSTPFFFPGYAYRPVIHLAGGVVDQIRSGTQIDIVCDNPGDCPPGVGSEIKYFDFSGTSWRYADNISSTIGIPGTGDQGPIVFARMAAVLPAVPEPETWVLMLLGICALATVKARSAASSRE